MMKIQMILYSDYIIYSILGLLVGISLMIPLVFAESIHYQNSYPVWYSYPCGDSSPSSLTHSSPQGKLANVWKYFSFYDESEQTCFITVHTYNFEDLVNIDNVTSVTYYTDTRAMIPTDLDLSDPNQINCELYYLGTVDTSANISLSPTLIGSAFDCTENNAQVIEATIPFNTAQNATLTTAIQAGNYSQSFVLFPALNATMRAYLDSNDYDYSIGKYQNSIIINGDGFSCITIEASGWCNMFDDPWGAIKKALGEDYIGSWFYVFVFFPIPFMVFLASRNGTYAGFVCLPILLFINTIDQVVFEISLSLMAIAGMFGVYEMLRKRLVE